MSKRVTLSDGARVEDRHHRHHLRLVVESKLAGRPEGATPFVYSEAAGADDSAEEVESAARHIDGSLASSAAEQWRKKGTGKLQTSGRQPGTGAQNIEAGDSVKSPPQAMVEQLESSETKKRGFEQVCILSRNPNEEADFGFQDEYADEATEDDEDSYEKIALGIGMLQARVMSLRSQLRESRPAGRHAKSVAVRFRSAAGALPLQPAASGFGKGATPRRKASDYDINNVVMPVSVGANYVELIRHERIETPKWRLVDEVHVAESSSSSENENTDDESYHRRHAELEAREKKNRIPERKPSESKSTSKSKPKVAAAAAAGGGGASKPKSKAGRPRKHKLPTPPPLDPSSDQQLKN